MEDPVAEISGIIQTLCTGTPEVQRSAVAIYFTSSASFTHPFCRTGSFPGSIWSIHMIYRWYKILSPHIEVAVDSVAFDKQNLLLYVSIHQNFKLWFVPFYNAPVKLVTVLQLSTDPDPEPEHDDTSTIHNLIGPVTIEAVVEQDLETSTGRNETNGKGKKKANQAPPNSRRKPSWRQGNPYSALASPDTPSSRGIDQKVKYFIHSQNDLYQTNEWIKFLVPWGVGAFLVIAWQFWATILCILGTMTYDAVTWVPRQLSGSKPKLQDVTEAEK